MVTKHPFAIRVVVRTAIALTAALVLSGCGDNDELAVEEPAAPQQVVTIGGALSSPGLISGTDPAEVSGAEVDLVNTLVQRMETLPEEATPLWMPTGPTSVGQHLADGDLDVAIGQFTAADLPNDIARIGPYATVQAGLLVHQESTAEADDPIDEFAPVTVESLDEVAEASVCVVADSLPDRVGVPVDDVTVEPTVTECEVGMRSGRYAAIAADDLQLAGVIMDPGVADRYELVLWADLVADQDDDDSEVNVDDALLETRQYWIGASSTYCADAWEAFEALVSEGVLEELFEPWDQVEGYRYKPVEGDEVSIEHCEAAS